MILNRLVGLAGLIVAAAVVAGCSSPRRDLVGEWYEDGNPEATLQITESTLLSESPTGARHLREYTVVEEGGDYVVITIRRVGEEGQVPVRIDFENRNRFRNMTSGTVFVRKQ